MLDKKFNLTDKKIAIVTHKSLMPCIPGDDMKKFLLRKGCNTLLFITHPLLLIKESYSLSSNYQFYNNKKLIKSSISFHWVFPEYLSYIKDLFYTFFWILRSKEKLDLYIGINNINALAGLLLKKLGRAKKVIYYTIDLYPQRFNSWVVNWIYHQLDNLCVKFCDETWNVSPFLEKYRMQKGIDEKSKQFTVPIGIWFDEMKRTQLNKVQKTKIVYVGHLKDFYGVDLIIRAMPKILAKIPRLKLEIIGGGEQMEQLKQLAADLAIDQFIIFHGWKEKKKAEELMSDASIGLAPFNTDILDERVKNGDPAKIKDYLALGLPIVMTNASLNAKLISDSKCAILIEFTPISLANAVIKLLSDQKLWRKYRENALEFVRQFDWNYLFEKNISRLI